MAIVKSKHASDYTVLPNDIFRDNLSIEAIGLLAVLLSNKHDWVIYKTTLHSTIGIGREKLDRVFKELQEKGYIISVKKIEEGSGRFEYEHIVYDKPYNGEPITAFPPAANTPLTKNNNNKEEYNNKEINKESFDLFLEMVNRVTSKKYRGDTKSKRNFLARVKQGYKIEDMEKALKSAMQVKTHIETKFMYLTPEFITRPDKLETYLNAFKEEKQGMSNEAYREFVGLNN